MRQTHRGVAVLLAAGVLISGCYGPFNLTRRLYQWNGQVGDKWEKELVFLLLVALPVYQLTTFGDAVVFNSMEFWTGRNPVDPPGSRKSALPSSQTKRLVRGDQEVLLTYASTPAGANLLIEQFRRGQGVGGFRVEQRNGRTAGYDDDGRLLFTAATRTEGGIVIHDGSGQQVALYSAEQVQQFVDSAR
ncbi:MAG: DUF3332 family protein [Candidatus Omnitrophota bacterium]|nr:DUF3332 family protein [Candidatus Omnitrophota bacterium]